LDSFTLTITTNCNLDMTSSFYTSELGFSRM